MASLMRLVCHELIGVMSWAACQSMWWSLICECLTSDDFSKYPLRPCARCSLILVGRFRPVSPMYTFPHSQGIRYTPALLLGSGCPCVYMGVCVCLGIQTGTYNKRNNRVPSWKKAPVCQTCTKHMRGVAKMLEYKQKRNNGRTPFAGVYKFVCVCVCVCVEVLEVCWGRSGRLGCLLSGVCAEVYATSNLSRERSG